MKAIPYAIIAILLTGCFPAIEDVINPKVDPELKPYLESFFREAELRGVIIKNPNVSLRFGNPPGNARTYLPTRTITIDRTSDKYKYRTEELLFHEFGHLFLGREHDNSRFGEYGYAKTIMCTNNSAGYEQIGAEYKRRYYIDELFSSSIKNPEWSNKEF